MARRSLLILLLIGILLASCAPSAGQPTQDISTLVAANAQTMVSALVQTQTALAPPATNTALPTPTSAPTSTALTTLLLASPTVYIQQPVVIAASPTGPTPTPLASSLAVGCNNLRLIKSYTDPDGPFNPGQTFTQFWQVENNGTCDWLYLYEIVFVSGDKLGETTSVRFGNKIPPGKWTTLSIGLHAPANSGNYKSAWRMSDGSGKVFGAVLTVSISVGGPTKTPKAPTGTPDLQGTANAANTAAAAQNQTATAAAQQTATAAAQKTLDACSTAIAQGTPPPCP